MPAFDVRAFSLFEIGMDGADSPIYLHRLDKPVPAGTTLEGAIDFAKSHIGSQELSNAPAPGRHVGRSQRDLVAEEVGDDLDAHRPTVVGRHLQRSEDRDAHGTTVGA